MTPRKRRVGRNPRDKLSVADVAKQMGVHASTVYRWIANGDLSCSEERGVKMVTRTALTRFKNEFF